MPAGNLNLLENSKSPLKEITEKMLVMISQVTIEGIYIYVNSAYKTILGYEPSDLLNTSCFDIIHPDDLNKARTLFAKALTTGDFDNLIIRYRGADGGYYRLETVGSVVHNKDNGIAGIVFGTKDISISKKMEQEIDRLDRLRQIGEMASIIAHEIRNPMTTIRGFLQLLADKEECSDNKDYFNFMIEEIDAANATIAQVLGMAREKRVNYAMHDLNAVIESIYPFLEAEAIKSDKKIILKLNAVPQIYIDARAIRQLIFNLVRNGMESMDQRGNLTISTICKEELVILAIEDQGHGIAADVLDKLGTPFFTTKQIGTGLGLTVCYKIAAQNNATIDIKTNKYGSTFSVIFKINNEEPLISESFKMQAEKILESVRCVS